MSTQEGDPSGLHLAYNGLFTLVASCEEVRLSWFSRTAVALFVHLRGTPDRWCIFPSSTACCLLLRLS